MYRTYYHHNQPVVSAKTGMYGNVPYLLPSQRCPFLCLSPGNDVPFYAYHTGPLTHDKQTMSPFMLIISGNDDVPFYAYQLLISRFMPIRTMMSPFMLISSWYRVLCLSERWCHLFCLSDPDIASECGKNFKSSLLKIGSFFRAVCPVWVFSPAKTTMLHFNFTSLKCSLYWLNQIVVWESIMIK